MNKGKLFTSWIARKEEEAAINDRAWGFKRPQHHCGIGHHGGLRSRGSLGPTKAIHGLGLVAGLLGG